MKKILALFLGLLFSIILCLPAFAASVEPILREGNDSNPNDYTPPEGCTHYEIPSSATPGTYTVRYNSQGQIDENGCCEFTVTIGKLPDKDYTQVLSWESTCAVFAVIVKGGDAFNLYQYPSTARSDTDLVSPNNASGHPADISHVSIVVCPGSCPTVTPTETPTETPTCTPAPPPCSDITTTLLVFVIIAFFLLGAIIGAISCCLCKKHHC